MADPPDARCTEVMTLEETMRALDASARALEDLLANLERLNFALLDLVPEERRPARSDEVAREESARRAG
jgi:hypothetical protein